jgi:hypothetical protein
MTALAALRAKAAEKYKPYPIEFDDGTSVTLQSILELSKDDLAAFNASSKRLSALEEDQDLDVLREEFISILAGVSSDKALTASKLEAEGLGTLTVIFEDYAGSLSEGTKSEATAGTAS